ncbi:MAG: GNAT family N-acetyltransferase [Pseudomonadota bacterium]
MRIEVATPEDAAEIAALHSASWRDAYGPLLPSGALPARLEEMHRTLWARVFSPEGSGTLVLTARQDGALMAFAAVHRDADQPTLDFLAALHVRPGARSGGIGARMIAEIARRRAVAERLWCWVLRENASGRRFYARLGATEGKAQTVPLTQTTACVDIRLDFPPWPDLQGQAQDMIARRTG